MRFSKDWIISPFHFIFEVETRLARLLFSILCVSFWNLCDAVGQLKFFGNNTSRDYVWDRFLPYFAGEEFFHFLWIFFGPFLILSFSIFILIEVFRPRARAVLFVLFQSYVLLFLAVRNPQLLEDFTTFNSFAEMLVPFLNPSLVYGTATLLILSFWPKKSSRRQQAFQAAMVIPLALFLFYWNNPFLPWTTDTPKAENSQGHILLIGLDGVHPHLLQELAVQGSYPYTQQFFARSKVYANAYTEIARTSPTLASILSGVPPHSSELRMTLQNPTKALQAAGESAHMQAWRKKGGQVQIRFSDSDYAYFKSPSLFTKSEYPSSQALSLFGPFLIRNRILFSFFNNPALSFLFPTVILNSAFQNSYDVRFFLKEVKSDLATLNAPTVLMSHLTKIHWPGSFPYPYYLFRPENDVSNSRFAYNSILEPWNPRKRMKAKFNAFNEKLYERGHSLLLDHYVEPLFEYLQKQGFLEKSTIVLYSDHNENFNVRPVPNNAFPVHGTWIPPFDRSNLTTLVISQPGETPEIIATPVTMHSILPDLILNQLPVQKNGAVKVMETDWQQAPLFPFEFWQIKPNLAELSLEPGLVALSPEVVDGFLKSKIRSIYFEGHYFSLFPTGKGYFWILNQIVQKNTSTEIFTKAWSEFQKIYREDFKNHYLPALEFGRQLGQQAVLMRLADDALETEEGRLLQSTFNFNNFIHLKEALDHLKMVAESSASSSRARAIAHSQLIQLCSPEWEKVLQATGLTARDYKIPIRWEDFDEREYFPGLESCWANQDRAIRGNIPKLLMKKSFFHRLELASPSKSTRRRPVVAAVADENEFEYDRSPTWPFWNDPQLNIASNNEETVLLNVSQVSQSLESGLCRFVQSSTSEQKVYSCAKN